MATGTEPQLLIDQVRDQLTRLLGLSACRFQDGAAGIGNPPRLLRDGRVVTAGQAWDTGHAGLPPGRDTELLAEAGGLLQGGVRPATALVPAAGVAAAGIMVLAPPSRWRQSARAALGALGGGRRESLLPGWSARRVWTLSFLLCAAVAARDAASGPHLVLIGVLITGPCCAAGTCA